MNPENPEALKALRELLGEGFTLQEVVELVEQDPSLLSVADSLREILQQRADQPLPPLSADFTQKVLEKLPTRRSLGKIFQDFLSVRNLSWAGGAAVALFASVYFGLRIFFPSPTLVAQLHPKVQPGSQKIYRVRFTTHQPQAQSVELAGDFNQWIPLPLKKEANGTFVGDLALSKGTYAYAFVLDGQKWVPDETVPRRVEDGFGNVNSLLNL